MGVAKPLLAKALPLLQGIPYPGIKAVNSLGAVGNHGLDRHLGARPATSAWFLDYSGWFGLPERPGRLSNALWPLLPDRFACLTAPWRTHPSRLAAPAAPLEYVPRLRNGWAPDHAVKPVLTFPPRAAGNPDAGSPEPQLLPGTRQPPHRPHEDPDQCPEVMPAGRDGQQWVRPQAQ